VRNQIFHILRKDVRQFWREIVLSVAIVVAYAWHQVARPETTGYAFHNFSFQSQVLSLLVPLAWASSFCAPYKLRVWSATGNSG
jgi:hypothetical protein